MHARMQARAKNEKPKPEWKGALIYEANNRS